MPKLFWAVVELLDTPVLLPGKSHGLRSLVGCSPWGHEESDTTERLHFHFSLSCIGEGNGNPLQCSCLENPKDGGAWWAAIYGVTQSWTRLKWLSISNLGSGTKKCWESASLWIWFPKHIWSENPVPPVYPTDYWGNEEHSMGGGILENGGKGGPDWWTSLETIGVTMRNKSLLCY